MDDTRKKDPSVCVMSKRRFNLYRQQLQELFGDDISTKATQLLCSILEYDPDAKTYSKHRGEIIARYRDRLKNSTQTI